MVLSAFILSYIFYAVIGVFLLFALANLFHLLRFGLVGFGGLFVGLVFVAAAALLVFQAVDTIQAADWSASLTLPFSRAAS